MMNSFASDISGTLSCRLPFKNMKKKSFGKKMWIFIDGSFF